MDGGAGTVAGAPAGGARRTLEQAAMPRQRTAATQRPQLLVARGVGQDGEVVVAVRAPADRLRRVVDHDAPEHFTLDLLKS